MAGRYQMRYRWAQSRVFNATFAKRFVMLLAGRRFGKTHIGLGRLLACAVKKPGAICWYVAPTYKQAQMIAWGILLQMIPKEMRLHKDETDLSITILNGATITLKGADHPDSLRGPGLDYVVMDEFATMDPTVWFEVLRSALSDKEGSALFIGTPKGFNHFYDMWLFAGDPKNVEEWARFKFTTADGGYVSTRELKSLKAQMASRQFAQEHEASFENMQGRIYYSFDRENNVTVAAEYVPGASLLIGMDFNVNPMTANVSHITQTQMGPQLLTFDEFSLPNSNTAEMICAIQGKYGTDKHVIVYPDPSGVARKTSAPVGQTDFSLLRAAGFEVYAPSRAYSLADRYATANTRLCDANGYRSVLINPRCTELIKSYDGLTVKKGTNIADKSSGLDHITDAHGYKICGVMPVGNNVQVEELNW